MGLAASQCRILYLTARQSDVVFEMACIAQEQQRIANETAKIGEDYAAALHNKKISFVNYGDDGSISTQDITYANLEAAGYSIVSTNSKKVYAKAETHTEDDGTETRTWEVPKDENGDPVSLVYRVTGNTIVDEEGNEQENEENLDNGDYIKLGDDYYKLSDAAALIKGGTRLISTKLMEGSISLAILTNTGSQLVDYREDGTFKEEYDTSDDAEAEAKYTSALARLTAIDKELDTELGLLETEQSAITKELESIQEIVKNNIDKSYGIFAES